MRCPKLNKPLFYILSLTWGLPTTAAGLVAALILLIFGKRPAGYHGRLHFSFGRHWGGMSLGLVFLTQHDASTRLKNHECGHSIQNCLFGFLMPFLVNLPSFSRYWWRNFQKKCGKTPKTAYDDIWFERQATQWGASLDT